MALVIAAIVALIAYSTVHGPRYRAEVCMAYAGRTACKKVSAKSEEAVLRAGREGACADIASGVTDTINCTQSEPVKVTWRERGR